MIEDTVYKIALAGFLHDIGKFAERAEEKRTASGEASGAYYSDKEFLDRNRSLYQPLYKGNYTHKHAVYTAAFLDDMESILPEIFHKGQWGLGDSFVNLAAGHHKPETPLQWIIAIADRVSSGFDRDEFESYNKGIGLRDYRKTRMLTILEGVRTDEKRVDDNLDSYKYRYLLKELSPESVFPVQLPDNKGVEQEYSELFFLFVDALERLIHRQNIPLWFEHFESLFMIYASHIPAATVGRVVPDVSLYDHSKTTSALASALYLYHSENGAMEIERIQDYDEEKFLIVSGDFYGIQNFIFTEGGSTNKAAAKLLRGRSFAVSLISELAADMLCREIGLTSVSVILSAAGKFTIIAPNTQSAKEHIEAVKKQINDWLIKKSYGESSFGISYIEAACSDFTTERFSELWDRLAVKAEMKKYSKIDLNAYGGAIEDYLQEFNSDLHERLCPFCGKRPSSSAVENDRLLGDEKSACRICRDHIYIGANLVKAGRIAVADTDAELYGDKLMEPIFGRYQVSLDVDGKLKDMVGKGDLIKYWDISVSKTGDIAKDITAKFINGYVPVFDESDMHDDRYLAGRQSDKKKEELIDQIREDKDNKTPKTFSHITKKALNLTDRPDKFTGTEALGVLKADVDNLGLIFSCGLRRKSLSRLATLSRQMNSFFSIYLPFSMSKREEFKDIYTVFAGGDDLFLIGPWNRIIEFASFLNDEFRRYVCHNPQVTISAGMSLNKPGEPVKMISDFAEDALEKAKHGGRNAVTLFGETVKWDKFNKLNEINSEILRWQEGKYISNVMLYRFNTFTDLASEERKLRNPELQTSITLEDMECLKWHSAFKYNLARNVGKDLKGQEKEDAVREVEKAAEWFKDYGGAMKIPVWQILYNQRQGRADYVLER